MIDVILTIVDEEGECDDSQKAAQVAICKEWCGSGALQPNAGAIWEIC